MKPWSTSNHCESDIMSSFFMIAQKRWWIFYDFIQTRSTVPYLTPICIACPFNKHYSCVTFSEIVLFESHPRMNLNHTETNSKDMWRIYFNKLCCKHKHAMSLTPILWVTVHLFFHNFCKMTFWFSMKGNHDRSKICQHGFLTCTLTLRIDVRGVRYL